MPCREVASTAVQQYRAYQDDGSSGKTFDSDSDCSGSDEMATAHSTNGVRACSRGKWLKTLRTVIDMMDGGGSRRRPRQVKTILRPPTTYVFVIGMSGLPSKVAIYPKRMWGDPSEVDAWLQDDWQAIRQDVMKYYKNRTPRYYHYFVVWFILLIYFSCDFDQIIWS